MAQAAPRGRLVRQQSNTPPAAQSTIPRGPAPTGTTRREPSPDLPRLHLTVKQGDVVGAVRILDACHNVEINSLDHKGRTPLHHACLNTTNAQDLVFLLLRRGAYVHAATLRNLLTPLHCACVKGNYEVIRLLLKYGADPNARNTDGKLPFQLMPNNKESKKFLKFLSKPAEIPKPSKKDKELLTAVIMESEGRVLDCLDKGVDINVSEERTRMTPLMCACRQGSVGLATTLLYHCADVHRQDAGKNTALHWAAAKGSPEIVAKLCEFDASVNLTEKDNGYTALHWGAAKNHASLVPLLIKSHANPNLPDNDGLTVLATACRYGHYSFVEALLQYPNVKVNIPDVYGVTPLHMAIRRGDYRIASLLVKTGRANASAQTLTLSTPLHDACEDPSAKTINLLIAYGRSDVNARNFQGNTPLHLLIIAFTKEPARLLKSTLQSIQLFLENRADFNLKNDEGKSPLMFTNVSNAIVNNSPEYQVALELVRAGANASAIENEVFLSYLAPREQNYATELAAILRVAQRQTS